VRKKFGVWVRVGWRLACNERAALLTHNDPARKGCTTRLAKSANTIQITKKPNQNQKTKDPEIARKYGGRLMRWQYDPRVHAYQPTSEGAADDDEGEGGVPSYREWALPARCGFGGGLCVGGLFEVKDFAVAAVFSHATPHPQPPQKQNFTASSRACGSRCTTRPASSSGCCATRRARCCSPRRASIPTSCRGTGAAAVGDGGGGWGLPGGCALCAVWRAGYGREKL
jgi:hypothetical protein